MSMISQEEADAEFKEVNDRYFGRIENTEIKNKKLIKDLEEKNSININDYENILIQNLPYELIHKIYYINKNKADIEIETQKNKNKLTMILNSEIIPDWILPEELNEEYPYNGIWSEFYEPTIYNWLDTSGFFWRNCI